MSEQILPIQGDQSPRVRRLADFEQADRDRLNELTLAARRPGALLGRDVQLSNEDRERFVAIADTVDERIAPIYDDPRWVKMNELIEEGTKKGVLFSFITHENTNVDTWLVDGGDDAKVKKTLIHTDKGDTPGIEVPTGIFNAYHWQNTSQQLRELATKSDDTLKGRSARSLGFALWQLGSFIQTTNKSVSSHE